ncbi:MAG TPA: aminotransferase class V-fold PLP-dependent enzyme, partial [Nitrososphaerales archaeon]|nr:aminotransferase class V-fold PLP-dependent enzyme [Nitrososphaerales archaeon]
MITNLEEEFPIKHRNSYFNNASYTPVSARATKAIFRAIQSYATIGPSDEYYRDMREGADSCRKKLASLIKAPFDSIVFTEGATQSINFVANGLMLEKGDTIITRGGTSEHPSNFLPWEYYA